MERGVFQEVGQIYGNDATSAGIGTQKVVFIMYLLIFKINWLFAEGAQL